MSLVKPHLFLVIFSLVAYACVSEGDSETKDNNLPSHFPNINYPEDNLYNEKRIALGKKLFHDPILSRDSTISCASCHKKEFAFADNKAISPGFEGRLGFRNAPSILNVVYRPKLNKDGGARTIELQALVPIEDEAEMNFNIREAASRLEKNEEYMRLSKEAFGTKPTAFVITRALAAFQRTLISANSHYDDFLKGDINALSEEQKRGKDLFFSTRTQCSSCHEGVLFTNQKFENNGNKSFYDDTGRERVTNVPSDSGKFAVPSLRNVTLTAPYMHDGSIETLEEVIEHYNRGEKKHAKQSEKIKPLNLSLNEKRDLIAFLHALTDKDL